MAPPGKKWVVGMDLRPRSQGAIRFARWLVDHSSAEGGEKMFGLHILEEAYLQSALRYHHLNELMTGAKEAAESAIAKADATASFAEVTIEKGLTAERALELAREAREADGIIVGRAAAREGAAVVRLGRVARRTLRTLQAPVVVVPPDYPRGTEDGPVIAACNARDDCVGAVRFAERMATALNLDLILAYVVPTPKSFLPNDALDQIRAEHQTKGEEDLAQWAKVHGFASGQQVVTTGSVCGNLVGIGADRNANLLVAGTRRLSTAERFFLTSIGSELAATAPCPVAVVPPG